MRKLAVSDHDLLHLFHMCLDAEERCEQRCQEKRERGDHQSAPYEAQLRDKYAYIKARVFEALQEGASNDTLEEIANRLFGIRDKAVRFVKPSPTRA